MDTIQIKEKVAKELDISYDDVDFVVDWVYKYSKKMTQEVTEIGLCGFGKIQISPYKIERRLKKYDNFLADKSPLSENTKEALKKQKQELEKVYDKVKHKRNS